MIGRLHGRIVERRPPFLLLDVNGVGYEIEAPISTFCMLPENDDPVVLHTHLVIRDDAHVLYGFACAADRSLFRTLLKVSGVGGKMALAILSGMTATEFSLTVQTGDVAALTRLPGIGKKTAERLIMEMRDRIDKLESAGLTAAGKAARAITPPAISASEEAVAALLALGYKPAEAQRLVRAVAAEDMSTEEVIRAALRGSAGKGR